MRINWENIQKWDTDHVSDFVFIYLVSFLRFHFVKFMYSKSILRIVTIFQQKLWL